MKKIVIILISLIFFTLPSMADVVTISVDDAVDLALNNNLSLQAKRKKIEELKQDVRIANALKNPQFQSNILMGKVTRGNSSQFGAALPIEIAKRGVRKKAALANLRLVENEVRANEHDLRISVMSAYFDVLYYKSVVLILYEREGLYKDMTLLAKARPQNSVNYQIDILQSDIKHKKQVILLNKAKANLLNAQFHLNDTLNLQDSSKMYDVEELSLFEDVSILNINIPEYNTIEDIAMRYSYSIRIADNNIDRFEKELQIAKHKRIPDLTVAGGVAYQTSRQTGGDSLPGAYAGAFFDIPVLYTYSPEIQKAKITLERAKIDKLSFESRLKIALKQDYNKFKYAKENMGYYKQILKESDDILKMSTSRYEKGQTTFLNLIVIENSHQEILNEYISAMEVYYQAYLDLMHNMGHDILLEEDI